MAALSLRRIRKRYGKADDVIKGIDLDIADGEFMVFVGPSGCGKSTLLRMIAGLETVDDGELCIDGVVANHVAPAQRGIAMVFQSYALYPHMTVHDNMAFALKLAGQSKAEIERAVTQVAGILQIDHLLQRFPRELSGGQRQRVAIGRAIVRQPKVFLFDEPLSNLDAGLRVQMRVELARLHRTLGTTMIYVTHDQVEAMTLGQRIAVFNQGRIEQVGAPLALYREPANLFVAGFLGAPKMNLIATRCTRTQDGSAWFQTDHGLCWSAPYPDAVPGQAYWLGIRAEHVLITHDAGRENTVPARLTHVEHLGDTDVAYGLLEGMSEPWAVKSAAGSIVSDQSGSFAMHCPAQHLHLFDQAGERVRTVAQDRSVVA